MVALGLLAVAVASGGCGFVGSSIEERETKKKKAEEMIRKTKEEYLNEVIKKKKKIEPLTFDISGVLK